MAEVAQQKAAHTAYYAEDVAQRLKDSDEAFASRLLRKRWTSAAAGNTPEDRELAYQQSVRAVRQAIMGAARDAQGVVDKAFRGQTQEIYGAVEHLHKLAVEMGSGVPAPSKPIIPS